jgi:hypothetical protein
MQSSKISILFLESTTIFPVSWVWLIKDVRNSVGLLYPSIKHQQLKNASSVAILFRVFSPCAEKYK